MEKFLSKYKYLNTLIKNINQKVQYLYIRLFIRDKFKSQVALWYADNNSRKTKRLDYPKLNQKSIVFDLGGYLGDFAFDINQKYNCKVYLFEPHPKFFEKCYLRFKNNKNIRVFNYGIGDKDGLFFLSDSLDDSSFENPNHVNKKSIKCEIRDFLTVIEDLDIQKIDLMKINIEGDEYKLLNHISKNEKITFTDQYQIQFHNFVEGAENKREKIISELKKTHIRTWCYEFVWENWELV